MAKIEMQVIDSHTEGEPTRMVVAGGPLLGHGSLFERRALFAKAFDHYRSLTANEPRGYDAVVGALLCEPVDTSCAAGLIFFNNTGYIGMCGHGTIGAAVTLAHMGRISIGVHRFETPVGTVSVNLHSANEVTIENVESYVSQRDVELNVPGLGRVTGDIAWGGNWFFLCHSSPCELTVAHIGELTRQAEALKATLVRQGITGDGGAEIDHIEFFGAAHAKDANSRNFVLCPGGAYDRSPCGTGTSAKLACLAAAGKLKPGETWVQESVIGSRFQASYRATAKGVIPSIKGRAYVTAHATLVADPADPLLPNGFRDR
ncbi:MAG: proline racemase family protein [Brachymonas sp.]